MKIKKLVRWKELDTLRILWRAVANTPYLVFTKVRMSDVIGREPKERISPEDFDFLRMAHFDFVICELRPPCVPVLAIEFDGPHHEEEPQVKRDIMKNRLCWRAKFPLLRIGCAELEEYDKITLLGYIIKRFIAWQREHGEILARIQTYADTLEREELHRLTEDGVLPPSLDPSLQFDIKHKFPGIARVARRLLTYYGILSHHISKNSVSKLGPRDSLFWYETFPGCATYPSGLQQQVLECVYTLYRLDLSIKGLRWRPAILDNSNSQILYQGTVESSMNMALPVREDCEPEEPPLDFILRTGEVPLVPMDVPGVALFGIARWFSEYLALRQVEKWAERHLPSATRPRS